MTAHSRHASSYTRRNSPPVEPLNSSWGGDLPREQSTDSTGSRSGRRHAIDSGLPRRHNLEVRANSKTSIPCFDSFTHKLHRFPIKAGRLLRSHRQIIPRYSEEVRCERDKW